jgi:hypothetical protein
MWKVTITRKGALGEHNFDYKFEGRPSTDAAAAWVTILSGHHTAALDAEGNPIEGFGSGTFLLDFDARNTLPAPNERDIGSAEYTYSRPDKVNTATINAKFRKVWDDDRKKKQDVDYAYSKRPGNGGTMDFTTSGVAGDHANAKWSVRSRWEQTGAGRCDVKATAPELSTPITASECWSTSFKSMYLRAGWNPAAGYGDEATDCVFPSAEYSSLSL